MPILNSSPALPVVLLLPTAIAIPIVALLRKRLAYILTVAVMAVVTVISALNMAKVLDGGPIHYWLGGWFPPIGIEYVLDRLSAFVILVVNAVAFLVLAHSRRLVDREIPDPGKHVPYYAVALLMLCGFNGILVTGDFFNLYVWLEICSLSLYGLVAVGSRKSAVAAFRYLIMGTVGACFYLLGLGFLFTVTGTLNMADLKAIFPQVAGQPTAVIGLVLMVVGFGLKMALFPLHGWLPDAYTQAPSSSSALIAPIGTKVAAYVLIRVLFFVFGVEYVRQAVPVTQVIGGLAAAGILFGSVMAMAQKELKRMLAYSSVAQIGYIGLGIGLANPLGFVGAVLHVMNHAVMKALLFLAAGHFRMKLGHSTVPEFDESVRRRMPWTTAAFAVGALSMVGLPPAVGFFSKWYLALGAVGRSNWVFLGVILLSSLLNAVYFFRVIERLYFVRGKTTAGSPEDAPAAVRAEAPWPMLVPVLILAAAIIGLGLLNAVVVKGILAAAVPPGMG
ncbi:MAG: monovalent cation/H+ antiporter subunit D family protein [Candidatus Aminicenantes bacterium]|nr:monovalent cation/H+ antiporter subunit D family protein [Candidatus Aminicenantes bacterium]